MKNKKPQMTAEQKTLFGKPAIKRHYRLNENQLAMLESFYLNPEAKITQQTIYKVMQNRVHKNTIANFFKKAEDMGLIRRLKKIPGVTINTVFQFYKGPSLFEEDKTPVPDTRAEYYVITQTGKDLFKLSEKQKR
jgi:hypothetical protein